MIQFKLNDKPLILPSCWEDTTFQQYIEIMKGKASGLSEAISLFTGIDIESIRKAKFTVLDIVIQTLSFLNKTPDFKGKADKIGSYMLPLNSKGEYNIQFESLAQFEDMRKVIARIDGKNVVSITMSYAEFVSIYLQKIRDTEYNYDKSKAMIPEIMGMPAHEVIKAGSFFLIKLSNLLTGTTTICQTTSPVPRKKKLVSATSKKRSGRSRQSSKRRSR